MAIDKPELKTRGWAIGRASRISTGKPKGTGKASGHADRMAEGKARGWSPRKGEDEGRDRDRVARKAAKAIPGAL